jgi:hypothetical protein
MSTIWSSTPRHTDRLPDCLTDHQLQCDFGFDLTNIHNSHTRQIKWNYPSQYGKYIYKRHQHRSYTKYEYMLQTHERIEEGIHQTLNLRTEAQQFHQQFYSHMKMNYVGRNMQRACTSDAEEILTLKLLQVFRCKLHVRRILTDRNE